MSQQLLAKIGVFGLIVVNLGAYYVFWPDSSPHGPGESGKVDAAPPRTDKADNLGKPLQIAPSAGAAQPGEPAKTLASKDVTPPGNIPPSEPLVKEPPALSDPLSGATVGATSNLPAIPKPFEIVLPTPPRSSLVQAKTEDPTIEQLKRLKESFGKETGSKTVPPDPFTVPTKEFPDLKPVPALPQHAAPRPFQTDNSPWSVQMEIAGGQKVLTARLNKRLEFRIACEQVEMKTLDGAVVAIGKISFTGPGVRGSCNRITIGLSGDSLVLDGKAEVQIQQGSSGDATAELKGEQLTLRLQQPAGGLTPVQALPAPTAPTPSTPRPFLVPGPFSPEKKGP